MKKLPMIILFVADQQRSSTFYEIILNQPPVLNVPGMTEFMLTAHFKLGIMPEKSIAKIICPQTADPKLGSGIPRSELYLIVNDPDLALNLALSAGAKEISKMRLRDWGDSVAYCADPDGHIVAFVK